MSRRAPYLRLVVFGGLFLILTAAGIAWAVSNSGLDVEHLRALGDLSPGLQVLVGALSLLLMATDMLRYRLCGGAIGVKVSWLACWDATVASNFFSWITPGSALGEPATVYVLGRRGVPWDAAAVLAYGKTVSGMVLLFLVTFVLLAVGYVPDLHPALFLPFVSGTVVLFALLVPLLVGVFAPERTTAFFERRFDGVASWRLLSGPRCQRAVTWLRTTTTSGIERLAAFRAAGFSGSLGILIGHLLYYGAFTGVLVTLAYGWGGRVEEVYPMAIVYQSFTYVLPTPGGSGISEGTAADFFGQALTPETAVVVVVLYRALTFYLHILIGLVYLPLVGGIRGVLEHRRGDDVPSPQP